MMRGVSVLVVAATLVATAAPASAEPDPATPDPAVATVAAAEAAPPVDDGKVASSPPATTKAPDGATLTISAKDETQMPAAPLTTTAGGMF